MTTDIATPKKPIRKKASKVEVDPTVPLRLRWNLHELPSSQHKAGLAGLVLCARFLARKSDRVGVCDVVDVDEAGATLKVDREGMQSLFDDVYAARHVETASKSKWKDAEPLRVDDIEVKDARGKVKTEKRFIYERVQPLAALVADWDKGTADGTRYWLKLWQDLIWSALRGVPATREPYNARAESRPSDDGREAWDELATTPDASVDLPSTYALGVQAKSAENASFSDVAKTRFLLHFWPFVVAIYVPATLKRDGSRDFSGHALAMPDIAVLDAFVDDWEKVARSRGTEPAGYVPRDAVVDLAGEAALDVVRRADQVMAERQGASQLRHWLTAVDVFHIEKDGNNLRTRGLSRIVPSRQQVSEYERIRRAEYWSPVFRHRRIANVLERRPWWHDFARLCAVTPQELTIESNQFRHDARVAMKEETGMTDEVEKDMSIEHLVYRRVQSYVLGKTERKYDLSWASVKGTPREKDYAEKKEKVAKEAFLAVRSRTGADFVGYFTTTICSVPQHVGEAKYLELARALLDPKEVEKVRSLTLLALSAV